MSLPYHKVDWDLVAKVERVQRRLDEVQKQQAEMYRLISKTLAEVHKILDKVPT